MISRILTASMVFGMLALSSSVFASVPPSQPEQLQKTIPKTPSISDPSDLLEHLLSVPENEIDLLWSILVIDKYIDPNVDVEKTYRQIEDMAKQVKKMAGRNASVDTKIKAIRKYIYKSGEWNDHKPFSYDFNNPNGRLAEHKTLDYYLTHRRGNCVSMPLLFLVMARQLDVDMTLVTAPNHLQVQYVDPQTKKSINLETTSGGNPSRPEWLRTFRGGWTDRAIETGMYLKPLSDRQIIAEVGTTILQRLYNEKKDYWEDIEVAVVMLEQYPQSDIPLLHINGSAEHIVVSEYFSKYEDPNLMSPKDKEKVLSYMRMGDSVLEKLHKLGYKFPERQVQIPINQSPLPVMPNGAFAFGQPTMSIPAFPSPQMPDPFQGMPNTQQPNPYLLSR